MATASLPPAIDLHLEGHLRQPRQEKADDTCELSIYLEKKLRAKESIRVKVGLCNPIPLLLLTAHDDPSSGNLLETLFCVHFRRFIVMMYLSSEKLVSQTIFLAYLGRSRGFQCHAIRYPSMSSQHFTSNGIHGANFKARLVTR